MTEDEIKALQDAKAATDVELAEAREAARVATEAAGKSKADVDKIVAELTEERRKKQEVIDKAKLTSGEVDVNDLVTQAFNKREGERRTSDFNQAMTEFKNSKTEFTADAAGLVYSRFEDGLKRFNFSDVETKEQMKERLEEAYRFLKPSSEAAEQTYLGNSSNPAPVPQANPSQSLAEQKVLESTGMDKEKYSKLKSKYGDAFTSLGLD